MSAPGSFFTIQSFDAWTSGDDGDNNLSGNVTFVGTEYLTGDLFTDTLFIDPTGIGGDEWDVDLDFVGTSLEGVSLVSLGFDLSANAIDYLALDNIDFSAVPEPAPLGSFFSGLLVLLGISRIRRTVEARPS